MGGLFDLEVIALDLDLTLDFGLTIVVACLTKFLLPLALELVLF